MNPIIRMENREDFDLTGTITGQYQGNQLFQKLIGYHYKPFVGGWLWRVSEGDSYGTKHIKLLPIFDQINFHATTFVGKQAAEVAQLMQPFTDKKTNNKQYFDLTKQCVSIGNNLVALYFALAQLLVGCLYQEAH